MKILLVLLSTLLTYSLNVKADEPEADPLGTGDDVTVVTEIEYVRVSNKKDESVKPRQVDEDVSLPTITAKKN